MYTESSLARSLLYLQRDDDSGSSVVIAFKQGSDDIEMALLE